MLMELCKGNKFLDPRCVKRIEVTRTGAGAFITTWDGDTIYVDDSVSAVNEKYEFAMRRMRVELGESAMRIPR